MRHFKSLVKPYILWSFLLIVIPLLLIVLYSLTTGGNSLLNIQFTLDNFKKIAFALNSNGNTVSCRNEQNKEE